MDKKRKDKMHRLVRLLDFQLVAIIVSMKQEEREKLVAVARLTKELLFSLPHRHNRMIDTCSTFDAAITE